MTSERYNATMGYNKVDTKSKVKQSARPVGDEHVQHALDAAATQYACAAIWLERADDALRVAEDYYAENNVKEALVYLEHYNHLMKRSKGEIK